MKKYVSKSDISSMLDADDGDGAASKFFLEKDEEGSACVYRRLVHFEDIMVSNVLNDNFSQMMFENFSSKIVHPKFQKNIIEIMKTEALPLVIWGAGSMSYSIRKILKSNGISLTACWVDHAESTDVDGIPVMSIDEIIDKYGTVNVVFGHSKYELADTIVNREGIHECFCLVNVCYGQWDHLSYEFVQDHIKDYYETYRYLNDELSRECMVAFLNCKLTEDFHYLLSVCREKASYFENPFFEIGESECLADIGAYDGDTIRDFLSIKNNYSQIYAIEPESENFNKLKQYVAREKLHNIQLFQCGCWGSNTILCFQEDKESSGLGAKGREKLKVYKLDSLLSGKDVTIIKINFLNGVCETLDGASNIIKKQMPKLAIMVGFDEWGLIKIPQRIKELNPDYKISLRYASAMPARLILFAY